MNRIRDILQAAYFETEYGRIWAQIIGMTIQELVTHFTKPLSLKSSFQDHLPTVSSQSDDLN